MKSQTGVTLSILIAIIIAIGLGLGVMYGLKSVAPLGSGNGKTTVLNTKQTYDFTGMNVKHELDFSNKYTGTAVNPTVYIYTKKPDDWLNGRHDPDSGYDETGTASSGVYTYQNVPGTYYVWATLSGYYDEFFTITIPSSSDTNINDYNAQPPATRVKMVQADSLSLSNLDLGITTNETSDRTYTKVQTITVSDNKGYWLDQFKLQEDSTYQFATDTDGDGIYNEGINKVEALVSYGAQNKDWIPFDVASSVNDFSGDSLAVLDLNNNDWKIPEQNTFSITFKITCSQTLYYNSSVLGTSAGDEKCGNGETFMKAILIDQQGTTSTFNIIG